ncbi:MAG TPA: carbamoyl-phosphate synthase large subunit, partial [Spirochaetota bacterium]|nr:carbamoyl-phosphate synthase large subunit [Spirochaetota bacterium]
MPRRNDIDSILVIGAGPIIIGQACEFDYSGSQACKALKKDGFRVVLVNSNPATIMTDPETAHKTYIEPITPEVIKKIIIKEKVSAVLPTIGGQTGLNAAVQVAEDGFLQKHNVELIGADIEAIEKAEDRDSFCKAMHKIGLQTTRSGIAYSLQEAMAIIKDIAFPVIIRAAYTLGGTGGSIAYNLDEFKELVQKGIDLSMVGEVMIEQSILGWKEYELEVMRDTRDNVIIICSIENLDPMGIHTGDSITVAPQQTLSDKEYQRLRDMSIAIIREIGVETGGSNIQFAVNPENGEVIVIEMNPRVSRSSALASKATGFPIAKIAALLAVGYTLDEIANDITRSTPASFEPMIDYVVTKIPRFTFEKFSSSASELGIQMRSVGETMSIGRTFKESLQKGIRGMETGRYGFDGIYFSYKKLNQARVKQKTLADMKADIDENIITDIKRKLESKDCNRIYYLKDAFYAGLDMDEIYRLTAIDKWFLANLKEIYDLEQRFYGTALKSLDKEALRQLKAAGFSDYQIAFITGSSENEVRAYRQEQEVLNNFKIV